MGRLIGVVAGFVIWYQFVGPALYDTNFILMLVTLVAFPFIGLLAGTWITLWFLSGRH